MVFYGGVFESSGDLGVPKVSKLPLTVPKSPSFTKRRHAPLRPAVMPSNVNSSSTNKPNAARSTRIVQQGLISSAESARRLSQESLKRSVVRPGSTLSSQRARPMTTPKVTKTAAVKPAVTVPRPFQLATGARADKYQEQFRHKLDGWKRIEKENQFKALPLPTYPDKFVPKKSTKPLTHSVALHLRTDQRAHEREVYEKERQRKEKILQDMLAEKAREDELREQQDVKEMRQRLVPHPTPIRDYPRIEIHKSTRQLTVPKSPVIGEKRKRQLTLDRELSRSAEEDRPLKIEEDPHRQRQDRVRAEIEEQRTKDAQEQQQQQQQQQQNHMQYQNKRPRVSVGTPVDPTIFVNMGRKSWLEFNDL
ncbi:hypothetical protein BGZ99_000205 [Dissophora globulifera]|uniref:TPX2 C-terminal domain-containing protein n=1 Tax=Dissophora globulifera TaxID=979702 RepID=A0A9P6RPS5_9FUNG|nr:hypothetical protein BGZ99_000205 [Dissophora globulifera]